jgi:hypothetical protein
VQIVTLVSLSRWRSSIVPSTASKSSAFPHKKPNKRYRHTVDHLHHLRSLEQETLIGPSLVEEIVLESLGLHLQKELGRILAKLRKESVDVGRKIIVSRREVRNRRYSVGIEKRI